MEFQRIGRFEARPPETGCLQIKAVDKCTDEAARIVRANMLVHALRKQQWL